MMPPPAYMHCARAGQHHVQVQVLGCDVARDPPFESVLTTRVERVFKSRTLRVGDRACFGIKTYRKPNLPPPDAGGWIEADSLREVGYLEAILNGRDGAYEVAAFGALYRTLESPTDRPTIRVPGWGMVALAWVAFRLDRPIRWELYQ